MSDPAGTIVAAAFGAIAGSFLNVCIHRLPRKQSVVRPASACPACGRRIRAHENVPVLSWLFLRGKCAGCAARIPARYPVVEIAAAAIAAYAAWRFGLSAAAAGALLFGWSMLALAVIDLDTQLLPDDITLPLLWAGLLFNLERVFVPLPTAVIGAVAGYLALWLVYWAFKLATGKEGMGYGDFKLLAALGAWLGAEFLLAIVLLSSVVGAVIGIILLVVGKLAHRHIPMPFGPYLAGAGLLCLVLDPRQVPALLPFAFPFGAP